MGLFSLCKIWKSTFCINRNLDFILKGSPCLKMKFSLINFLRIISPSHPWSKVLTRTQEVERAWTKKYFQNCKTISSDSRTYRYSHDKLISISSYISRLNQSCFTPKYKFVLFKAGYYIQLYLFAIVKMRFYHQRLSISFVHNFCSQIFIEVVPSILVVNIFSLEKFLANLSCNDCWQCFEL